MGYTNLRTQYDHPAFAINVMYNYNPYLPIGAEIQIGTLSGGGLTQKLDSAGRQYTNKYKALVIHADFLLGTAIDYQDSWLLQILKNFYIGTGFGLISNSNTVQRTNIILSRGPLTYVFPGSDNSINLMIPIRAGYEFKIFDAYNVPRAAIDIGYIHNFAFGEGLDGYDDPTSKFKNNAIDQYRQIVVGVKFFFGKTVSYNKLIRNFN